LNNGEKNNVHTITINFGHKMLLKWFRKIWNWKKIYHN